MGKKKKHMPVKARPKPQEKTRKELRKEKRLEKKNRRIEYSAKKASLGKISSGPAGIAKPKIPEVSKEGIRSLNSPMILPLSSISFLTSFVLHKEMKVEKIQAKSIMLET